MSPVVLNYILRWPCQRADILDVGGEVEEEIGGSADACMSSDMQQNLLGLYEYL